MPIGGDALTITFHGVRGSTPCHGEDIVRYGGNTSCVALDVPGHDPVLLDLGTGLRYFGLTRPADQSFRGTGLLTHLHWDHVQGLPFFTPLLRPGSEMDIYAPTPGDALSVAAAFALTITPPMFPVSLDQLPGTIRFHDLLDDEIVIPPTKDVAGVRRVHELRVTSRSIPHVGPTAGYRLDWNGLTVSYLSDHQQPPDGSFEVTPNALELCRGADVLIHDAQYTAAEFARKNTWGHCMIEYAVWVARQCDVRTLVLFHHDPGHDDDMLDMLSAEAAACGRQQGIEVVAAYEGLSITLPR